MAIPNSRYQNHFHGVNFRWAKSIERHGPDQFVDIVILILLVLVRTSGLTQNVGSVESSVIITFSYSNHCDMTNSVIEISEVGVQLPVWQIILNLYA